MKAIFGFNLILFLILAMLTIPSCIELDQKVESPLKKAADAGNIASSYVLLDKAVTNIETLNFTEGNSSILYDTDENDLTIWYGQLAELRDEMTVLKDSTLTLMDESNYLIKLRETILDSSGEKGDVVTMPSNLIHYPYHGIMLFAIVICGILCIPGFFGMLDILGFD